MNRDVTSILPLTSTQSALWIHSKLQAEQDPGVLQVQFTLSGMLSIETLATAWQYTINQYEILRTSVHPHPTHEALLVCRRNLQTGIGHEDWTNLDPHKIHEHLLRYIDEDKKRGLSLEDSPSSRLTCVAVSENHHRLIWTCHHLLLDGWSSAVVVNSLMTNYRNVCQGIKDQPTEKLPYSAYRRIISHLDSDTATDYWRSVLTDVAQPSLIGSSPHLLEKPLLETVSQKGIAGESDSVIINFSKTHGITAATIAQSAWALLVGMLSQQDRVIIGLTVTGRPSGIENSDTIVGNLANIIPLPVNLDSELSIVKWLKENQSRQFSAREYDYVPYNEIIELGESSCRNGFFDALLIVENLPSITSSASDSLRISDYHSDITSRYPLNIVIQPNKAWAIKCRYDAHCFSPEWITSILKIMQNIIIALATPSTNSIKSLYALIAESLPSLQHSREELNNSYANVDISRLLTTSSGPKSRADFEMLGLFGQVLLEAPADMNADFFLSGGTSLSALRLISMIENHFDARIPVSKFLLNASPRALIDLIKSDDGVHEPIPSLVSLQASGSEPALFCLHAGGGHALFYRDFAQRLGTDRPVYALQPRGIDGFELPHDSIERMAQHYIDELRLQQPNGPYHLLGYCFGAAALLPEMAKQLQQQNQTIGHLIVVDSRAPIPRSHPMSPFGWTAYIRYEYLRQNSWNKALREIIRPYRWLQPLNELRSQLKRSIQIGKYSPASRRPSVRAETLPDYTPDHLNLVQKICHQAADKYRVDPMPYKIELLTTIDEDGKRATELNQDNWHTVAADVEVHPIQVHHRNLFLEPQVKTVSDCVKAILEQVAVNQVISDKNQDEK